MKWVFVGLALLLGVSAFSERPPAAMQKAVTIRAPAEPPLRPADGPLVVIDPGHGGTNDGAPGAVPGLFEKTLTLALARQLEDRLVARGFAVELTRDDDVYLTLRQRMDRANELGADLLISIHCNATAQHAQRGFETFVLSKRAVDVDARALCAEDGAARPGVDRRTAGVLDEVERGQAVADAADLAVDIQKQLARVRGSAGDRGVKQEAQHVLLGATMPAVLVEVGFIDHPIEGRELADPAVQSRIAGALAGAISEHFGRD